MYLSDELLKSIAKQYGTPTYVFDEQALRARMAEVRNIVGGTVGLCYSIKANPFLIPAMLGSADKLEVCSPGELAICRTLQVPADRIVYSGVNKQPADAADAAEYGAGILTAESIGQADLLEKTAAEADRTLPVLLRLYAGSQFGMSEDDLRWILSNRGRYPHLSVEGIHYFAGTARKHLEQQKAELPMLCDLLENLRKEYGMELPVLEYGPGLPFPYFEKDDFTDTLAPLRELAPALQSAAQRTRLTVEMGRFFASECGYYLTRADDIKNCGDKYYCILDGGMNHVNYFGQLMGMKVPVIRHLKMEPKGSGQRSYMLCGSLCTTADVLVREVPLTAMAVGDVLAFCNIGAYSVTEGVYLFLSRTMPKILLYDADRPDGRKIRVARDFTETSSLNCPLPEKEGI